MDTSEFETLNRIRRQPALQALGLIELGPESPHNFWKQGYSFFKAAKTLYEANPHELEFPMFHNLCLALELYLKSFLIRHGRSVLDLKKKMVFRHDLLRGLKLARSLDTNSIFTDELESCVVIIGPTYNERDFEYVAIGGWQLPNAAHFLSLVENVGSKLTC